MRVGFYSALKLAFIRVQVLCMSTHFLWAAGSTDLLTIPNLDIFSASIAQLDAQPRLNECSSKKHVTDEHAVRNCVQKTGAYARCAVV